ncbi:MAG: kynureninase [Saprospiraceae bacterium]
MSAKIFELSREYAQKLDLEDELREYKEHFHLPKQMNGKTFVYLCGNSLGLQPKSTEANIQQELLDWKNLGVEGHFHAKNPWMPYHEFLTGAMAKVVGAKPIEVVVMNTLTVNLHLMMISFYQPRGKRNKIVIEADAFPSDRYAVESQIRFHKLDPKECLIEIKAREGEYCLREEDILEVIDEQGGDTALVMLGNTNYYTGQYFNMKTISTHAHSQGCMVGFDCAHGVGNVHLDLHESGCDFAVWCNYKYLNAGPGSLGGAFVHERHSKAHNLPRLEGWWGHDQNTRFKMRDDFSPTPGVEAWQLSNPPILSMVAVWSSLQLFDEVGMDRLRKKSVSLTGYLEYLVKTLGDEVINVITPSNPAQRGSQLSIQVKKADKNIYNKITKAGVIADWREPDVIRVAPVAMYNSHEDVYNFYTILKESIGIENN